MQDNQREVDLAYVAGLIDGEGTFCISKSSYKRVSKNPAYTPYIRVGMTSKMAIELIRDITGMGTITYDNRDQRSGFGYKQKGFWLWSVSTVKKIPEFLDLILPYIRLKKPQALLMKEYCENFGYTKYRRAGLSPELVLYRESVWRKMSELNGNQRPQRLNPEAPQKGEAIV